MIVNITKNSAATDPNNYIGLIGFICKNISATITISDCVNNGNIIGAGNNTGGFIGGVYEGATALVIKFNNCINNGDVSSGYIKVNNADYGMYAGGLIGKITEKTQCIITNCSNSGNISSALNYAGGLIGCALSGAQNTITGSNNQGNITGDSYVGGIVGACNWDVNMSISDCGNTGSVTARYIYAGGIISYVHKGGNFINNKVENCTSTGKIKASGLNATSTYGKRENFAGNIIGRYDGNVTVIWSIDGNTSITSNIYPGGANNDASLRYPVYTGAVPTKAEDAQYTYTFVGWATSEGGEARIVEGLPLVLEDTNVFYAVFSATIKSYEITWVVNGDSRVVTLEYGEQPVYGSIPTKEATKEYEYTFAGWATTENGTAIAENNLPIVTKNQTYYAIFTQTEIEPETSSSSSSSSIEDTSSSSSIEDNSSSSSSSSIEDSSSSSEENSSSTTSSETIVSSSSSNKTSKKSGCGGNIGYGSMLLIILALVSITIFVKKKN